MIAKYLLKLRQQAEPEAVPAAPPVNPEPPAPETPPEPAAAPPPAAQVVVTGKTEAEIVLGKELEAERAARRAAEMKAGEFERDNQELRKFQTAPPATPEKKVKRKLILPTVLDDDGDE